MRLLTRTTRFTLLQLDRSRDRIEELHASNDHLRAKLNRTLGRRVLRFGRRRARRRQRRVGSGGDAGQTAEATETTEE
jgi:hypothetical protein